MALNPALTLPFVFTNGTIIDANQVNADFSALLGSINSNTQITLAGDMTFYVAPGGTDAPGNGLTATSPVATIQYMVDQLQTNYDLSGHVATIQLANGSYPQGVLISGNQTGQRVPGQLQIRGNAGAPNLVTVDGDPAFQISNGALVRIQDMTVQGSTSQGIISEYGAHVRFQNLIFGQTVGAHLFAARGGIIESTGNYAISGGGTTHLRGFQEGQIYIADRPGNYSNIPIGSPLVTITGVPNFTAFAASHSSFILVHAAFSGTATGQRSATNYNGVINIGGQGTTYLPGDILGTDQNGGVTA